MSFIHNLKNSLTQFNKNGKFFTVLKKQNQPLYKYTEYSLIRKIQINKEYEFSIYCKWQLLNDNN